MTRADDIRANHYRMLNRWQTDPKYLVCACYEEYEAYFETLVGTRWQIDEAIFDEFLNMLPPLRFTGDSFFMSEMLFGVIGTKFTREGDRYFCEYASLRPKLPEPRMLGGPTP